MPPAVISLSRLLDQRLGTFKTGQEWDSFGTLGVSRRPHWVGHWFSKGSVVNRQKVTITCWTQRVLVSIRSAGRIFVTSWVPSSGDLM